MLTIGFVLLAELLLFIPSLAIYRQNSLEARARSAGLLAEALMSNPQVEVNEMLSKRFMLDTDADFLAAFVDGRTVLLLGEPPPTDQIVVTTDLREQGFVQNFGATFAEFLGSGDGYLRVIADSPVAGQDRLEFILPCGAVRSDLRAYFRRILALSLLIALFTGGLIFLSMSRLIVQPVQRLARDMTRFREAPQIRRRGAPPAERADEIGQLQREFHDVKETLRTAFRQRERMAGLGLSVTKINHDLRNVLSTALLLADRLSMNADPDLAAMGERLTKTVERGVSLTEDVLKYSSANEADPDTQAVRLLDVVRDVARDLRLNFPRARVRTDIPPNMIVMADPDYLYRLFSNLMKNAAQAMSQAQQKEQSILVHAQQEGATAIIEISDNGPGLPEKVEDRLFLPFTSGGGEGSTGLGLSISRELAEVQGGSLELLSTGPDGTAFILGLPLAEG